MPNLKPHTIVLDPDDHEKLRRVAFETRSTVSALIREAVVDWLRRYERNEKKSKRK